MQTRVATQPIDYAQAIAKLVTQMPPERAIEVYDFACFLLTQPLPTPLTDQDNSDWLNDNEEQMQAEDALWELTYTRHQDKFVTLAETARAEINDGATQPMFNECGEIDLE
jgi:hypothetical protein